MKTFVVTAKVTTIVDPELHGEAFYSKPDDEIAGIAQEELSFVVREFFLGGTVRPDESIEVSVERAGS